MHDQILFYGNILQSLQLYFNLQIYNFFSYSVYNLQLNMVEFDLQIYNFRTNLNVDSTAQKGINLQSTFLAPPLCQSQYKCETDMTNLIFLREASKNIV